MSLPLRPEVQTLVRIRPVWRGFAHSFAPGPGCSCCSVLSSRARACRRNHQVPRVPLPDVGVTSSQGDVDRLLRGHYSPVVARTDSCANPAWLSHPSVCRLVQGVFAGCHQPLLPPESSRRYPCESVLKCLVPCPGGPTERMRLFLVPCHRPSPTGEWVGFPLLSANTTSRGSSFEGADIP
jgi:hypothetical protein